MDSYIFDPPAQIPTPEHNGSDQEDQTAVSVLNLQLPFGAIAPNIWLEAKEQPALAAVKLWLRGSFASAASKDALDDSTVHYGELSKRVRAACASEEGQRTALDAALQAAEHMARKPRAGGDWFVASRIAAKLTLPKASAFGSSLVMNETRTYDERGARNGGFRTFFCQDLRVPTLIGVNAYERKGRQPVVVNFSVDFSGDRPGSLQDEMALLFPLERELVRIIEKTEFETLETLADYTLKELRTVFEERGVRPWVVHLKFEKPCAVPFADAPVIEVHRRWN